MCINTNPFLLLFLFKRPSNYQIIILSGPFVEVVKFLPLRHLVVVFTPLKIIYTFKFKRSFSLSNYRSCEQTFTDADMNIGEQWLLLGSGNMWGELCVHVFNHTNRELNGSTWTSSASVLPLTVLVKTEPVSTARTETNMFKCPKWLMLGNIGKLFRRVRPTGREE